MSERTSWTEEHVNGVKFDTCTTYPLDDNEPTYSFYIDGFEVSQERFEDDLFEARNWKKWLEGYSDE